jgi:predicted CXXCH cytochrome family protein
VHDAHNTIFDEEAAESAAGRGIVPPEDFPTTREKYFACTGCHIPHGSDTINLWPGEMADFCIICHPY